MHILPKKRSLDVGPHLPPPSNKQEEELAMEST